MFAKWVFRLAGIYGVIVVAPLFFLRDVVEAPPAEAITRPEFYFGFAGVTLAFQLVFLVISTDPVRYRPLMPVCVLEKIAGTAFLLLYLLGETPANIGLGGAVDALLGVLFATAYFLTPRAGPRTHLDPVAAQQRR